MASGGSPLPLDLDPSILDAQTSPSGCAPYGSTSELFASVLESFITCGFARNVALGASFFVFASWHPDCLPAPPCLLITGPRYDAGLLLQLLGGMVRHGLALGEVTRADFCSLPLRRQVTLLLSNESISRSGKKLLSFSKNSGASLLSKGRLVEISCAKAVYLGNASDNGHIGGVSLKIDLAPFGTSLPICDSGTRIGIANFFQPRLLEYRRKNLAKVKNSSVDLPQSASDIRLLAQIFGGSIIDALKVLREHHRLLR